MMRIQGLTFVALLLLMLGAYSNAHSQSQLNWQPTSGPLTQYDVMVDRIVQDLKGNLFAETFGDGLWRSTNQGRTWKRYVRGLGIFVDGVDVDSSNRLYASSRLLMAYSDNEGLSWTKVPNPPSLDSAVAEFHLSSSGSGLLLSYSSVDDPERISTDLGNTWRVIPSITSDGDSTESIWWGDTISRSNDLPLYLSGDLGNSWTKIIIDSLHPEAICELASRINDTDVYAVLNGFGCYLSHDRGAHFFPIAETGGYTFFFAGSGKGTYIAGGNGADTVLISRDDCQHWVSMPSLLPYPNNHHCEILTRAGTMLFGGANTIIVSYDSGATWVTSNIKYAYSAKFVTHADELWTTTYDSALDMTMDDGDTWNYVKTPVPVSDFYITSSGAIVVNGWYADSYVSTDGGITWRDIFQGWPGGLTVIGDTIFLATDSTLLFSTSFGNQWDTLFLPDTVNGYPTLSYELTPQGAIWMFVQDTMRPQGSVCISNDLGKTFGTPIPATYGEIMVFDSNGTAYFWDYLDIYRSSDNGKTWDAIPLPWNDNYEDVSGIWGNDSELFVLSDSGVYRTSNMGATWITENTGIGDRLMGGPMCSQDGYYFLSTDGGVYRAKGSLLAQGETPLMSGLSMQHQHRTDTIAWAGVTQTMQAASRLISIPNPFSQSTEITFTSQAVGYADVSIVNLLGAEAAHLFSGELAAGEHSFEWSKPPGLPDGMYECLVRMNGHVETLPVMLMH